MIPVGKKAIFYQLCHRT